MKRWGWWPNKWNAYDFSMHLHSSPFGLAEARLIYSRSRAITQNDPQKMSASTQVKAAPAPVQKLKRNQHKKNTIEFKGVLPSHINTWNNQTIVRLFPNSFLFEVEAFCWKCQSLAEAISTRSLYKISLHHFQRVRVLHQYSMLFIHTTKPLSKLKQFSF